MHFDDGIFVAGHNGMVGSAITRKLNSLGYRNIITKNRKDLDLANQNNVSDFFQSNSIKYAIVAAAKVGGIHANNSFPAEFLYDNIAIAKNVIHEAYKAEVSRLIFLGSTCIYPKLAKQPIVEDSLLTSDLEPTNEAYAIAKIAGLKLCQYYRKQYGVMFHSVMPTNLYGTGDNYNLENAHVLPALINRFHSAKEENKNEVIVWGSGKPYREFLHADDAADGIIHLMTLENPPDWINLGSGEEISISNLAKLVSKIIGFNGEIKFDISKPDGTPRKFTNNELILKTGWKPKISLENGINMAYQDFLNDKSKGLLRL